MQPHPRFTHLASPEPPADILARFAPPVRAWWTTSLHDFTPPQALAIGSIAAGNHTLVCAPTGSGKTLCAFISVIDDLFRQHAAGTLSAGIQCVYISPLKALGADIHRNLSVPLEQIAALTGTDCPIRVAQRTGDTTPAQRAKMLKSPPHILITTPESLALCLANPGMRDHLASVRTVIVDELHALAGNKRGVDLALSVERLALHVMQHANADPVRIGLSATIAPLERMAEYLVGPANPGRACAIADASFNRPLELTIRAPFSRTPFATASSISRRVYDMLEDAIRTHRTILVFTNTRGGTERVTYALRKRFAGDPDITPEQIQAHHASLDRDLRLAIEAQLKAGELRCVVTSTSLELGVDIGSIDRVFLLNSPKGVSRGLQRVGRAGHSHGGTARGTFIPTVPNDLLEALVITRAMHAKRLDEIRIPANCLDVLCQHLIGMAAQAAPAGIPLDDAYHTARSTTPFATLTREDFDHCVRFLLGHTPTPQLTPTDTPTPSQAAKLTLETTPSSGAMVSGAGAPPGHAQCAPHPQLHPSPPDSEPRPSGSGQSPQGSPEAPDPAICLGTGSVSAGGGGPSAGSRAPNNVPIDLTNNVPPPRLHLARKSIAALYSQNVGTIASEGTVRVKLRDGGVIGTVQEAFAQILKPGDRFILAGRCVAFLSTKGMVVTVAYSDGLQPTVPRWLGDMIGMGDSLTAEIRDFRARVRAIAPAGASAIERMLMRQFHAPAEAAASAAAFLHAQFRYADIPLPDSLLIERTPDEDAIALVFHAMLGRHANEAVARLVAYRMHKCFGGNATVVVDDYAFGVWVPASSAARRADRTLVRTLLSPARMEADLETAIDASELYKTQFRHTALRAHAILQNRFGSRKFVGQLQGVATRLMEALRQADPDHILLRETRRAIFEDILCVPTARNFLESAQKLPLRILDLPGPSPFAFGLFATNRRDTLHVADAADFLLAMYHKVQQRIAATTPTPQEATLF